MKCISEMHGAATSHASPASESWQSDVLFYTQIWPSWWGPDGLIFWKHCCILRKYNMQREIYQVLLVRWFLIGLTVEDRSSSFDEAYRKIVRALKTGLAGICCVYKQSASVCANCVRIGGGWGMGGARFRKKWFTLK